MTALATRRIQIGTLATLATLVAGAWQPAAASHFRYAHISWVRTGPTSVAFTVQGAFRRSATPSFDECVNAATGAVIACTGADGLAAVGDVVREDIGDTQLEFGDGSAAYVSNPSNPSEHYLYFLVTSIDPTDNWYLGAALDPATLSTADTAIDHTYANTGPWTARIDSCCRISASDGPNAHINNPDGAYRIESRVDLSTVNDSPVSSFPPIVTCPQNGTCQFQILATDPDGDPIRFRLSTAAESAGDANFKQPGPPSAPNAASVSAGGLYTWNTTGATLASAGSNTLYSTQVSIEDLNASNVVKSKVALDFFIQLVPQVNHAPTFSQPACGATLAVNAGSPLQFTITAADQDAGDVVTLNASGVPGGASLAPLLPTAGNPVSSQLSWTPTLGDVGSHVVTFSATDQTSQQALCAVTIDVDATCGNGTIDPGEACDGGACCTADCQFATGECRASTGPCDAAETCSGASGDCPPDLPAVAGTPCGNPASSACDAPDSCDGGGVCATNVAPAGTPCGDAGSACTNQDTCDGAGACTDNGVQPAGTPCADDGNPCTDDVCDANGACGVPNSAPCDDGDACTSGDGCVDGSCTGGIPTICPTCETCDPLSGGCLPGPRPTPVPPAKARPGLDCRVPLSGRATLRIRDKSPDGGDLLTWKWKKWPDTLTGTFGDPVTTDAYTMCVFEDVDGATPVLAYRGDVPAGGTCGTRPCWRSLGNPSAPVGFKYLDKTAAADGMVKLKLKSVGDSPAKILVGGKGENLDDPGLPLALPVAVQLQTSSGECWGSIFDTAGVLKNAPPDFRARSE